MKIISLRFKNLNSLKGEFKIDFTDPILANAGLFAITGPTGAGKSTILDAITLALYSSTPRIGDINKNTIGDKGVIVTKGTKDAFAHIIFEVNSIIYKAEWGIYLNRNNNWSEITHKLSKEIGGITIPITEKRSDTKNSIKEIIGLDENQFTKAIVLSQGKFDEFLKSDKNKRYELLEIITGTQIYRELGKAVYQKLTEINNSIEGLNNQLAGITILSQDQLLEIEKDRKALVEKIKSLLGNIQTLDSKKLVKEQIIRNEKELELNQEQQNLLNQKNDAFAPDLLRLENHEKALPLQVDFNNWTNATIQLKELQLKSTNAFKDQNKFNTDKQALINQLSTDLKKTITEINFIPELETYFNLVSELEKAIQIGDENSKNKHDFLQQQIRQIPSASLQKIQNFKGSVVELNEFVKQSEAEIELLSLPTDLNSVGIEEYSNTQNALSESYRELVHIKKELDKHLIEEKDLLQKEFRLKKSMTDCSEKLNTCINLSEKISEEVSSIQAVVTANRNLMSLESFRNQLEEGKPCPCCGSEIHPYATIIPHINSELEDSLIAKKQELVNCEIEKNASDKQLGILEAQLFDSNESINKIKATISNIDTNYVTGCNNLNCNTNSTVNDLQSQLISIQQLIEKLKTYKIWEEAKKPLQIYILQLEEYIELKASLETKKVEKQNIFKGDTVLNYRDALNTKWASVNQQIESNLTLIKGLEDSFNQTNTSLQQLNTELTAKIQGLGFDSISVLNSVLLTASNFVNLKTKKESLKDEGIALASKRETFKTDLEAAIQKDDASMVLEDVVEQIHELTKEREGNLSTQGELTQTIKQNSDNQKSVAGLIELREQQQMEQKYYATLNSLIGDQTGNKFNNIIQRITLRHLFNMTNQRLLSLMARYQVDLGGEGQEDEIWVIDTFMGDEKRTINSVSGGERFVISLAMALALSDLASNNVKIDSMFIDEGFGSLSPDDLDNAITMLERMQVENEKIIGIISHVESLKERISTQIQVIKLQNGESTLRIKSNDSYQSLAM